MKNDTRQDEKWIRRTFVLARKGVSAVSPNPQVGCVIVKNGKLIAQGYHARFGGPHAELGALKKAGAQSRHSTLYTNLEPCCHWGKTPPCTDAIIQAGVKRVVSAMRDPNPLVKSGGFRALRKAGIQVKTGVCAEEAKELNRSFLKFILQKKPYVILKSAVSLDGKIATATGDSKWISSQPARRFSRQLRTEVDGILVGAGTARKDNPELTSHGLGRNPVRIILTESGKLPGTLKLFKGGPPTLIFSGKKRKKTAGAEWVQTKSKNGKLEISAVLKELAKRGISKLLVEGGGETVAQFLEAGEADELFLFLAPILIGGRTAKTFFEGKGAARVEHAVRIRQMDVSLIGADLLVHGRIGK